MRRPPPTALLAAAILPALTASLAAPAPAAAQVSSTPTVRPCLRTLEFAGLLFLDTDRVVPAGEVGSVAGVTDPDPARCGLGAGLTVLHHAGRLSTQELVYDLPDGTHELFQSAGAAGFPGQDLLRVLVVLLVVFVLGFAALPALLAHLRQPPIARGDGGGEVGETGADGEREPGQAEVASP
ncbi:MAG TPA: hypothetical protein VG245_09640 [Candidatus Dormibacteraeota bacterium]|nr:hypothetical protein [Candidatus Dormibacteraeota bacterium]